jgi:hypothetical protein
MDYKQTEIAGSSWHRFSRVTIENPYMEQPVIVCNEQEAINLPDRVFMREVNPMVFDFSLTESFPLLDPVTNEPLGSTGSGLDAYVLVYSYVMHEAAKRDAAEGQ